jgi:hypothetical protein
VFIQQYIFQTLTHHKNHQKNDLETHWISQIKKLAMKNTRQTKTDENSPDLLQQNKTRYLPKRKHKIIHFEWTITLIWEFICMQILWATHKVLRNPLTAWKKIASKETGSNILRHDIFIGNKSSRTKR